MEGMHVIIIVVCCMHGHNQSFSISGNLPLLQAVELHPDHADK